MRRIVSLVICVVMLLSTLVVGTVAVSAASLPNMTFDCVSVCDHSLNIQVNKYSGASYYRFYYRIEKADGTYTPWTRYEKKSSDLNWSNGKAAYSMYLNELYPEMSGSALRAYTPEYTVSLQYDVRALNSSKRFLTGEVNKCGTWSPAPCVTNARLFRHSSNPGIPAGFNDDWYADFAFSDTTLGDRENYALYVYNDVNNTWVNLEQYSIRWDSHKIYNFSAAGIERYSTPDGYRFTVRKKDNTNGMFLSGYFDTCVVFDKALTQIYLMSAEDCVTRAHVSTVSAANCHDADCEFHVQADFVNANG